jgi:hypothetical protein
MSSKLAPLMVLGLPFDEGEKKNGSLMWRGRVGMSAAS